MLHRAERLWACQTPWVPIPQSLLSRLPDLDVPPAALPSLLALIALTYARRDWPIVSASWRELSRALGISRHQVRRHMRTLRDRGLINWLQPLGRPRAHNRFDLSPLQERIAALHHLEHLVPKKADPLAQLQLIADPNNPRPEILHDVRRRRNDAIAAARRGIPDPPPTLTVTVVAEAPARPRARKQKGA